MSIHWGGRGFGHVSRKPAAAATPAASYSAEATAYFAAMSVQPDDVRKTALDALITGLNADGVLAKLDWLSILAAHDAQAARINVIDPTKVMTVSGSPTFTTDRGYTGDGAAAYLATGWNPSTAGGKFVQNDCHQGAWIGTDVTSSAQFDMGNTSAKFVGRTSTAATITGQSGSNTSATLGSSTSVGHLSWSRTGSTAGSVYKNGSSIASIATTSTALRNATFYVLAYNNSSTGTDTPAGWTTRRVQAVHWGSQLSAAETLALYNRLATYMTAVGA